MEIIVDKIKNFRTPFFYPWAWAVLLLSVFAIGAGCGLAMYLWCMITLGFM